MSNCSDLKSILTYDIIGDAVVAFQDESYVNIQLLISLIFKQITGDKIFDVEINYEAMKVHYNTQHL